MLSRDVLTLRGVTGRRARVDDIGIAPMPWRAGRLPLACPTRPRRFRTARN
jgi:hypothetical protein